MTHAPTCTTSGAPAAAHRAPTSQDTQAYFTETAHDYRAWSPGYNMNFGFWRAGLNPLRRETMLEAMNHAVGEALALPAGEGFAWGAGEAAAMVRVRNLLLDKGQPKEAMRVAAYWRQGQADYHEELGQ